MQTSNRLLDDLARVASGAMHTFSGVREEIELRVKERIERVMADLDLVTREEFDAVRLMATRAREQNELLLARIEALEAKLGDAATEAPAPAKPASRPKKKASPPADEGNSPG
ncbi:accessory factor UbiK family protein [Marinivivus vitaminiproducens]|uniref:accessory factor UbiK family protein n=1 Tax=Marinivivus vitaminiproducens TaxID=3035935 RepID=UPI0027A377EE|nr:accessory factor UbiK family protein [Geminicoccaceae bacterium SCSIO 64248]